MTGVFERTLGADFANLHPRMRERLALSDGLGMIGHGVMDRIWRGPGFTLPFRWLGSAWHILFPERGRNVPFTIENYPYLDGHGRETVSFVRTFEFPGRRRRFDAQMVHSTGRGLVDYLGTHRHLAVTVRPDGGFRIEVTVVHPRFGPVFGYAGGFSARFVDVGRGVSGAVKPLREKVMD
ncbi:DUF4166 domain-containing protein [Amycolatopsis sp. CA-126428]|uniref:DUF4166 domain-containing protein n=1 Tax=Amycolatopsis sp. CA-126428 TaxID=2073158 RepID=UPI000CD29A5B|nr:DUF4166 domain-containing protein [Amycolatopsis sp. CA-126428]